MLINVFRTGNLTVGAMQHPCALGRGGVLPAAEKREGDGATPAGLWPLRRVLYRPDRVAPPPSRLPVAALSQNDGWCDDPSNESYNRPVKLPYRASAEKMWRTDGLYDVVVILGYNDAPIVKGAGSAIFLHCASPKFGATEGCVAIERQSLIEVVALCGPGDAMAVF